MPSCLAIIAHIDKVCISLQVDKVVVLWTANTERYSNVSVLPLLDKAEHIKCTVIQSLKRHRLLLIKIVTL